MDHLLPTTAMTGLTANAHTDKGRTYDTLGWWPLNIYVDSAGTWHSYMHTRSAIQLQRGRWGYRRYRPEDDRGMDLDRLRRNLDIPACGSRC